jgi:putative ABC transport system permease protein
LDDEEGHEDFAYAVVGRMPRLGNPWDRAISAPIESVWWVHSLPVGHVVDDAALWPSGVAGEPELGAVPVGPPWDASELPGVPAIAVKPASFAAAYSLRQRYRAADDTMAVFPAEVLVQLYDLLGDVRDLVAALSLLTQVLVIGAVLLAVLATIALRRKSIAVLRALGASRPFVFATVWLNVALMLSTGAVLGLGLGYLGAIAVSAIFASRTGVDLPVALSWQEAQLVLGIILIGLVLATIPAALAYRGSVSSALRA